MIAELLKVSSMEDIIVGTNFAMLRQIGVSIDLAFAVCERTRPNVVKLLRELEREGVFTPGTRIFHAD